LLLWCGTEDFQLLFKSEHGFSSFKNRLHHRPGQLLSPHDQPPAASWYGCGAAEFFSWHSRGTCAEYRHVARRGRRTRKTNRHASRLEGSEDSHRAARRKPASTIARGAALRHYNCESFGRHHAGQHHLPPV